MLVNAILSIALLVLSGAYTWWSTGSIIHALPSALLSVVVTWLTIENAYMVVPRTITATIRKGRHSPPFWWRWWHMRIWLLRVPKEFEIRNLVITIRLNGEWNDLFSNKFQNRLDRNSPYHELLAQYGSPIMEQINKIGGMAWGIPHRTKNKKSWHPNSIRYGFPLAGSHCGYDYTNGDHSLRCSSFAPIGGFAGIPRQSFSKRLAYFLMPYFGGEIPAPCDIHISYTITFQYRNE